MKLKYLKLIIITLAFIITLVPLRLEAETLDDGRIVNISISAEGAETSYDASGKTRVKKVVGTIYDDASNTVENAENDISILVTYHLEGFNLGDTYTVSSSIVDAKDDTVLFNASNSISVSNDPTKKNIVVFKDINIEKGSYYFIHTFTGGNSPISVDGGDPVDDSFTINGKNDYSMMFDVGIINSNSEVTGVYETLREKALKGLITDLQSMVGKMNKTMTETGLGLFNDTDKFPFMNDLLALFKTVAWLLWGVGFALATMELSVDYASGKQNVVGYIFNICKSWIALVVLLEGALWLYNFALTQITKVWTDYLMTGYTYDTVFDTLPEQLTKEMGDNFFLIIAIEAVLVFFLFKTYLMVLKRTGIFITLLGIGTLHMIAIPKGVWDGFVGWTKQISGLCFTTFMQSTLLTIGGILMATYTGSFWLGLGVLASASEVPRLIDRFGIDTGSRQGVGGAVHTASMVMHIVKGVM